MLRSILSRLGHPGQGLAANGGAEQGKLAPSQSTDRWSRRSILTKGAIAGAVGLAATALARPKDAEAAYNLQGDGNNVGHSPTVITAVAGYPVASVFYADATVAPNGHGLQGSGGQRGVGGIFIGGRAHLQLIPSSYIYAGPPVAEFHDTGDIFMDKFGTLWVCLAAGTPGTFVPLQPGGADQAHFVAVSTKQYTLANSDGATWVDMDGASLALTIAPAFNCRAIISANSDLWTSTAGYNQDLGIFISGGSYGTGAVQAWKESGGYGGTYSPNAAFLETTQTLQTGSTYTIKLRWKANKNAAGATIWAGAGPIPAGSTTFSPTRLAVQLVVTQ